MTAIFISYERSAATIAKRVAEQLRAGGRDVWLDTELPLDRPYADVIRGRLEAASAVLVLWSKPAVQSEWVRSEADFARQQRKLVQASLDGAMPPMPFDQTHCADLKGWRGAESPAWRKVCETIDGLLECPPETPATQWRPPSPARQSIVLAVGLAVLAALAGLWVERDRLPWAAGPAATRVAILPLRVEAQDGAARAFADGLTDQIQATLTDNQTQMVARADVDSLAGADRDRKVQQMGVRALFDGSVQSNGQTLTVALHLNDPVHHLTLWSTQFSGLAAKPAELQAHIATRIVAVLNCSARALRPSDGLKESEALSQYLLACDLFAQSAEADSQRIFQMMAALRRVNALEPRFPPAHAALAKYLAWHAAISPPDQAAAFRQEAKTEAERAIQLDPKNADAYVALALLEPPRNWIQREALLRKGLAGEPDWPHANGFLGLALKDVGRMDEAAPFFARAAAANLQGEEWQSYEALFEASVGQVVGADAAVAYLKQYWPDDASRWFLRLGINLEEKRWDRALANLDEPVAARALSLEGLAFIRDYLQTMRSPTPKAIARTRAMQIASGNSGGAARVDAIEALASMGLLDDAFKLAEGYEPGLQRTGQASGFLFESRTAPMRRDPRFLELAGRIGLLDYWRKTGKWPDFCSDPTLSYTCK